MATVALRPSGSLVGPIHRDMDTYLKQGIPVLETCWKSLHDITNLTLHLEPKVRDEEVIDQQELENLVRMAMFQAFVELVYGLRQEHPTQRGKLPSTTAYTMTEALSLIALGSTYNHQLAVVIAQEQASAQELQNKDSSITRKLKKLTKLKSSLEELTKTVDRIMDFYTMQSLGFPPPNLPSLDELKEIKDKICGMKSTLKSGELHGLFYRYNEDIRTTEENIMCNILNITEDFGHRLSELKPPIRQHQTDQYFLESFIENRENEMRAEGTLVQEQGREGLTENLVKLGFTAERASAISANVPDDFIDLQTPSFWALRYLEHAFSHHLLFSNFPRYPYQEERTDEFFHHDIPLEGRFEPENSKADGKSAWPVKMYNVKNRKISDQTIKTFLREQEENSSKLFFHGTSHTSALSILGTGIQINEGKPAQDFSSGDGFYVSEEFDNAAEWSRAAKGNPQAIVVFKVPKKLVENDPNGKDLTSKDSEEDWARIVKVCRNKYNYKDKKMIKELKKATSFVRGPMCLNKDAVKKGGQPSGFGRRDDPASLQLCVRDDDYAERFGAIENICCVIFY